MTAAIGHRGAGPVVTYADDDPAAVEQFVANRATNGTMRTERPVMKPERAGVV